MVAAAGSQRVGYRVQGRQHRAALGDGFLRDDDEQHTGGQKESRRYQGGTVEESRARGPVTGGGEDDKGASY